MTDNGELLLPDGKGEALPPPPAASLDPEQRKMLIAAGVGFLVVLLFMGWSVYMLLQPTTDAARIRDVFIIFMAVESLLIGLTLVILMVQMARLINLLQNEIKPILDSTNETISTLRGTTEFLSTNLSEPIIKLNEYVAGLSQLLKLLGLGRKNSNR